MTYFGDWGIGDWGLWIGDGAQSPIPIHIINFLFIKIILLNIILILLYFIKIKMYYLTIYFWIFPFQ
jgi:hypothetical protein